MPDRTRPRHLRRRDRRRRRQAAAARAGASATSSTKAVLADEVGVDFIGVGEHHRADFAVSAPEVVLAAIAGRTTRIRLGSAVTVLSSDDPVRVFQRFSTLDAVVERPGRGDPRARLVHRVVPALRLRARPVRDAVRGEARPVRRACSSQEPVTWKGTTRAAARRTSASIRRSRPAPLKTWIGVGGSPESVVRAARYGLPLMLAIIGGDPQRFRPLRRPLPPRARASSASRRCRSACTRPGYVAETDEQAREELWPDYKQMRDRIGAERGWPPMSRAEFEREVEHGSLYVGSPETVARKIAATVKALGIARFDMKYSAGALAARAR